MNRALAATVAIVCVTATSAHAQTAADASAASSTGTLCKGCSEHLPEGDTKVPLVVLLHGDNQDPKTLAAAWLPTLRRRNIAMLAIKCPTDLGCPGSFWRWDGDPGYVAAQVARLGGKRPIDEHRRWLVGWSGGASYMGYRTQAFEELFSALVFHGGGMGPAQPSCAVEPRPVFFLVGDKNPLHHLAQGLRGHYQRCGQPVRWDLVAGADHAAEWRALPQHIDALVDALLALPVRALDAGANAGPNASLAPATSSPTSISAGEAPASVPTVAAVPAVPRAAGPKQGCRVGSGSIDRDGYAGIATLVLLLCWRARRRSWPASAS